MRIIDIYVFFYSIFDKRYRNSKGQQLEHGVYQAGKLLPRYNVSHSWLTHLFWADVPKEDKHLILEFADENYCTKRGNHNAPVTNPVISHEWREEREVLAPSGTYRSHLRHIYSVTVPSYGFYISELICDTPSYSLYSYFL